MSISHQGSDQAHTRGSGEQNGGSHKEGQKQFVHDARSYDVNVVIPGAVVWQWQGNNVATEKAIKLWGWNARQRNAKKDF